MSLALSRRALLKQAAAGATAVIVGEQIQSSPARAAAAPAGYIDAHAHIWTRDVETYPLAKGVTVADLAPPSFTAEELLDVANAENVGRVVLICHHPYYGFDNAYLLAAAAKHPQAFRIVGALDDNQPNPAAKMRELARQYVTGFRISPFVSGDKWLDSEGMRQMWRTGAETRQAMCCLISPEHLPPLEKMCEQHPDTPVVIDHCAQVGASGEIRREDLDRLCGFARFKQVFVKVSAFYALGKKAPPYHDLLPMIKRLIEAFGPERLMWASDAPYQHQDVHTYRASIALIRDQLDSVSDEDRAWLLTKTAEKVYFRNDA